MNHDHCCHVQHEKPSIDFKLKISLAALLVIIGISFLPLPFLTHLNHSLLSYLQLIWWAVLLGLFLGGLIDYFVPDGFIVKFLGVSSLRSIFYAVIAGFLLSACSHGILAIAIELHKKGASIASTVAFLTAAPWANLPVTILLFGFFGWQALLFILAAMLIAFVTGVIFHFLENFSLIEKSHSIKPNDEKTWNRVKNFNFKHSVSGIHDGMIKLANMVLWWIIVGILIAAFIGAYIPPHIFMDYFGPSFDGLVLTLLVATVIEICSEGSSPIAFEIFNKTGALGNPFVFLMAGVVTDYTEIGLLWSNIGKRTAIWLPIVTVPQVLLIGYLFNQM